MPSPLFTPSLPDALPIYLVAALMAADQRRAHLARRRLPAKAHDLDRQRKGAERPHMFRRIRDHDKARAGIGDDLLLQKRAAPRSEEHTSELQSRGHLVCRPRSSLPPYPTLFRSTSWPPSWPPTSVARTWRAVVCQPKRTISTGSGKAPSVRTCFDASAITTKRVLALATIFSCRSAPPPDRKSTRLNSSHVAISYAVPALHSLPTRRSSDLPRGRPHGRRPASRAPGAPSSASQSARSRPAAERRRASAHVSTHPRSRQSACWHWRRSSPAEARRPQIGRAHV